mmetsp:Transcript_13938/g.33390  ORF Transcript_13938/g.33390 Transcript_13938/m.33390 type:complete len:213 (+) Transcript_13938:2253-2891(+)
MLLTSMDAMVSCCCAARARTVRINTRARNSSMHATAIMTPSSDPAPHMDGGPSLNHSSLLPCSLAQLTAPSVGMASQVSAPASSCSDRVPARRYTTVVKKPSSAMTPITLAAHSRLSKYSPMPTPSSPSSAGPVFAMLYGCEKSSFSPPAWAALWAAAGSSSGTHRTRTPLMVTPVCARSAACDGGTSSIMAEILPSLTTRCSTMPRRSHAT